MLLEYSGRGFRHCASNALYTACHRLFGGDDDDDDGGGGGGGGRGVVVVVVVAISSVCFSLCTQCSNPNMNTRIPFITNYY